MSSTAKIAYLDTLTELLTANRPTGLPERVARKNDDNLMDLHIIPEHNLDPEKNQLPAMLFIAGDGAQLHPDLFTFELRLENRYNVDDFDEQLAAKWQAAIVTHMENREFAIRAINLALCEKEATWYVKKIQVGSPGESGVEGQRSRGLSDTWTVWMMRY